MRCWYEELVENAACRPAALIVGTPDAQGANAAPTPTTRFRAQGCSFLDFIRADRDVLENTERKLVQHRRVKHHSPGWRHVAPVSASSRNLPRASRCSLYSTRSFPNNPRHVQMPPLAGFRRTRSTAFVHHRDH